MDCDGCTLCCKLIKIEWMDSPAGEYCKECDPGIGCKIYDNAPEKCLLFKCAYNQMEKASINMRPDKCGIIFERLDDIIIGTIKPELETISNDIFKQLESFKNEGFSFVLYKKGQKPYVNTTGNYEKHEILNKIAMELKRINGST